MLLLGDSQIVSRCESFASAETVTSATASVVRPDGSVQGPLSVAYSPTTPSQNITFRTTLTAPLPGEYRLYWLLQMGDGSTLNRCETHFAAYTDMGALIRRRLRETSSSLEENDLDSEIAFTVRSLVDRFEPLQNMGGYGGLTGPDRDRFDRAVGLLTALRFRTFRPKSVPLGEIERVQLGQNGFYFVPSAQSSPRSYGVPLEQQWFEEAVVSLGHVSAIRTLYQAAAASYKPFVVSGATRAAQATGALETLASSILRLLTDAWQVGEPPEDYAADYEE